jgi:hypothetical protein
MTSPHEARPFSMHLGFDGRSSSDSLLIYLHV